MSLTSNKNLQHTMHINNKDLKDAMLEINKEKLLYIYDALVEKGYNPIAQITGYVMTEDPIYITTHKNARNIATKLSTEDIMDVLLHSFLETNNRNIK